MAEIINLILITLMPFFELRASIPYGVFSTDLSLLTIFLVCVVTNIILAPILYFFLDKVIHVFLEVNAINKIYQKTITKAQKKVHKYVEKYGILGLALFIAIPLPGSGVYSGALGAYVLGFKLHEFLKAAIIGVLIAGIIVLLISTAGNGAFNILLKSV